tara:strand:- start:6331 stop:6801 length:471 start_codon:yes stop_codon:yes gene_type:complete
MKDIKHYQVSFAGTTPASSFEFQFPRYYKQAPHHKFILRCLNLTDYRAGSLAVNPHSYYATGFLGDGLCLYSGITSEGIQTNDYFLGTTSTNGAEATSPTNVGTSTSILPCDLMLNDIPTNPFKIQYRHTASSSFATGTIELLVVFEIIEYDPSGH